MITNIYERIIGEWKAWTPVTETLIAWQPLKA